MTLGRMALRACACAIVVLVGVAGCRPASPPDPEKVLDYFRNARVKGDVRRVWPEGQRYVDAVLKADWALQVATQPFEDFRKVQSLWTVDDPRWRDDAALVRRIDGLVELIEGGAPKRAQLVKKLGETISGVPAGLGLEGAERSEFISAVWKSLRVDGADLREAVPRWEEETREHLRLYRRVRENFVDLDPNQAGLRFKDEAINAFVRKDHERLDQRLRKTRDNLLERWGKELPELAERLRGLKGRERGYPQARLKYLRDRAEAIPKELRGLIEKTEERIEQLEAAKADLPASDTKGRAAIDEKIKFQSAHKEQLEAEMESLRQRVRGMLDEVKQAEGGAASGEK